MSVGNVYVMSNESMPGLLKIGFTKRPVEERLQEANQPNTWIPTPFSIELSKCVTNPEAKELTIHRILAAERVNPNREFFRVGMDKVKLLFDLMDAVEPVEVALPEEDVRLTGDEVIRMFLDEHVFPPDIESAVEPITWGRIQATFQIWKRAKGFSNGNAMKIRELLIEQYGPPTRGEGWTTFRFRV